MTNLIEIDNLGKRYDGFTLADVSLAVEPGSVVGFIGSNGAGKTTTLKAALGLIGADTGTVRLFGEEVRPGASALDALKARIGVVLDTCAFPGTCTVKSVGSIGRAAYASWDSARFAALTERFELAPRKKVSELSRGMGMKLTLAFALAHHPELLILDEATAGLDPLAREDVLDLLRDFMAEGDRGIFMSTHITSDLEKIADEVVCLDAGRVVFSLPKDAITDEAGVARCRAAELEAVLASDFLSADAVRIERHGFGCNLLVPDRFAFARAFPDIPVDAATIEDYMTLTLKGESR
ncbi:ABC transporter ATP-binding protein [Adlercreutzia sp. R21]|uniref:ABC transporter ATP-binding protein n=1 Tax=Adlercreutzia wanghongyangiae TaxID=3111451 RepID=A0ABU6IK07_9ACTN|nr:ABC transporter ATP-binding protein [Adlercreutzia sp. R21]MEC4176754.1 ABC transporter ATP-binding protein [Adlercreutzia sp. R7]MEC4184678.1 ABC transporter ATP-binding protein [Adlercreutzia sp. R21]